MLLPLAISLMYLHQYHPLPENDTATYEETTADAPWLIATSWISPSAREHALKASIMHLIFLKSSSNLDEV
jgi:hypothetical protein